MFITLEGIEGSGKTTQIKHIADYFDGTGSPFLITREPGGTTIGQKIRSILLDPASKELDSTTELLLYFADRVQHLQQVIKPAIAQGQIVICDRYYDATMAYQGYARGLDQNRISRLHHQLCDNLNPDLTLLFDLSPQVGLARAWDQIENGRRTQDESRFEKEKIVFHEKVRAGYLSIAEKAPERFVIVDAAQSEIDVRNEIIGILSSRLEK
jgi:dTMP kinase